MCFSLKFLIPFSILYSTFSVMLFIYIKIDYFYTDNLLSNHILYFLYWFYCNASYLFKSEFHFFILILL